MTRAVLLILAVLAVTGMALGRAPALALAVDERSLDNPAMEADAREIMKGIRCLVCQNQSIEDSNADLARDLRRVVRERVAAGDDGDAVRAYLVARYGDWILLRPPFKGRTMALWLAPLIFLLIGASAASIAILRRRAGSSPVSDDLSDEDEARIARLRKDLRA